MNRKGIIVLLALSLVSLVVLRLVYRKITTKPIPIAKHYKTHHVSRAGFEHIFLGSLKNCNGCHHIIAQDCGKAVLSEVTQQDKNGVFKAKVSLLNKGDVCKKEGSSTFFPKSWTIQETLNAIEEAYQNQRKSKTLNGFLSGDTHNGMIICFSMLDDSIYTAFPIMQSE